MRPTKLNLGLKFSIAVTVIIGVTMLAVATLIVQLPAGVAAPEYGGQ